MEIKRTFNTSAEAFQLKMISVSISEVLNVLIVLLIQMIQRHSNMYETSAADLLYRR